MNINDIMLEEFKKHTDKGKQLLILYILHEIL